MTRDEVIEWSDKEVEHALSQWGRKYRVTNHNGYPKENHLHKIRKTRVLIVDFCRNDEEIPELLVKAVDNCMQGLELVNNEARYVLYRLYCHQWNMADCVRKPLVGCTWSKNKVSRLKNKGISFFKMNLYKYYA